MNINKSEYIAKISNASPVELTIITYELAQKYLYEAKNNITCSNENYQLFLTKAKACVEDLINALNMSFTMSKDLLKIYFYVNQLIIKSSFSFNDLYLNECLKILQTLEYSFKIADKKINTPTIINNNIQIFAGLTYHKDGLKEYVLQDESRGFKA